MSLKTDTIQDAVREALEGLQVSFAVLYGSFAVERATPISDIDVALYTDDRSTFLDAVVRLDEAFPDHRVDVVHLKDQPSLIYYQILATGRLLFCRDHALFHREKYRVMREYLDFKPVHDRILQDMRQRIDDGTYGRSTGPA